MKTDTNISNNHIARMSFLWNALYAGFCALQPSIILIALSRRGNLSDAGIVTIGAAIATLAMIVAIYGIRNYQVTDTHEEYSFSDYFYARAITVVGTLALSITYVCTMTLCGRYTFYKGIIIIEIVILKLIDAFESVFVGRLQQKGRLDIGARIATIRTVLSTVVIFLLILIDVNVIASFLAGIVTSVIVDILMLRKLEQSRQFALGQIDRLDVQKLLIVTMPLCIGTALHNYIGNGAKYLVDFYLNDEIQAISGYIMMPMFVITVVNTFLMQPTLKSLGDAWNSHNATLMRKMVIRHVMIILLAAVAVWGLGVFIGLPLLSLLYHVELVPYGREFMIIMVGGTFFTLSAYGIVLLTAMRRQKWILIGCATTILVYFVLGKWLVTSNGLMGASQVYAISNLVLLSIFGIAIIV